MISDWKIPVISPLYLNLQKNPRHAGPRLPSPGGHGQLIARSLGCLGEDGQKKPGFIPPGHLFNSWDFYGCSSLQKYRISLDISWVLAHLHLCHHATVDAVDHVNSSWGDQNPPLGRKIRPAFLVILFSEDLQTASQRSKKMVTGARPATQRTCRDMSRLATTKKWICFLDLKMFFHTR